MVRLSKGDEGDEKETIKDKSGSHGEVAGPAIGGALKGKGTMSPKGPKRAILGVCSYQNKRREKEVPVPPRPATRQQRWRRETSRHDTHHTRTPKTKVDAKRFHTLSSLHLPNRSTMTPSRNPRRRRRLGGGGRGTNLSRRGSRRFPRWTGTTAFAE